MEEAKKSGAAGAAKSQTDPVVDPAVRTFVAVSLRRRLTHYPSTLPAWDKTKPEERKSGLRQADDSMRLWTVRELAGFRGVDLPEKFTSHRTRRFLQDLIRPDSKVKYIKPTIKRTPEEIEAAHAQLTWKAFGVRVLWGKTAPYWLGLPQEIRENDTRNFDHELQKWVGNQKIGSQVRQLSVQTWVEHRERKSAASRGADRKSAASVRKNTTPDVER